MPGLVTGSFGGTLTPAQVWALLNALIEGAPFSASLTRAPTSTGNMAFPTVAPAGFAWLEQLQEVPELAPGDRALIVSVAKIAGLLPVSSEMQADAAVNITTWVQGALADSLSRDLDLGILGGGGAPAPTGVLGQADPVDGASLTEATGKAIAAIGEAGGTTNTIAMRPTVYAAELTRARRPRAPGPPGRPARLPRPEDRAGPRPGQPAGLRRDQVLPGARPGLERDPARRPAPRRDAAAGQGPRQRGHPGEGQGDPQAERRRADLKPGPQAGRPRDRWPVVGVVGTAAGPAREWRAALRRGAGHRRRVVGGRAASRGGAHVGGVRRDPGADAPGRASRHRDAVGVLRAGRARRGSRRGDDPRRVASLVPVRAVRSVPLPHPSLAGRDAAGTTLPEPLVPGARRTGRVVRCAPAGHVRGSSRCRRAGRASGPGSSPGSRSARTAGLPRPRSITCAAAQPGTGRATSGRSVTRATRQSPAGRAARRGREPQVPGMRGEVAATARTGRPRMYCSPQCRWKAGMSRRGIGGGRVSPSGRPDRRRPDRVAGHPGVMRAPRNGTPGWEDAALRRARPRARVEGLTPTPARARSARLPDRP